MSILSTNKKLINIGKEYSAGSGIDITNDVISVIGNTVPYSAGENIDIQDFVISGKDWSNDITDASSNAYNETTAWVHDNYTNSADVSFLSAEVDKKLDSSAWEAISGSLATEDYVILSDNLTYARATAFTTAQEYAKESACNSAFDYLNENKLDASSFSEVSASFLTAINIPESATWNEVSQAYEQASGTYLTSVSIPESATWNDVSTTVQTNSAQWADGGTGDEEVNSFVYDNSATINEVNTTYQQNSANYLTAHQSLNGYATTAEVDTLSSMLSGAIDYVSANASGSSVISSYTTTWSPDVPPYGSQVINSLNGLYISSFLSRNANNAGFANNANSASSAGYAQTVNTIYVENEGFVRNLSSEYGTISVVHNNLIESTNSAILRTGYEGFVSLFGSKNIGPYGSIANFSWDKSLPNTKFTFTVRYPGTNTTVHYSANTNLTGEILAPGGTETTFSIDVPNVTSLNISANQYVAITGNVASAADTFETTVGELAWASALPTYQYDNSNKISAINGSAIAAGDEFPASANEAITAYQTNSGNYLTAISIPESATWNNVSTTVQTNSSNWDNVINKLDTTSFSDVSSTFLTAVDLTPYATTNDLEQVSGDITALIPSTAGLASESYVQTNSAVLTGMIDAKQDTLTFGYDEQDRINSINNSALAGGGDVPEDVMVETNLEYNAVNEISGYNGSAIAQYGAEKQWLVHDDTLVHAANSAQYALGVAIDNVARLMGIDETVLWSGARQTTGTIQLSESMWNYDLMDIYVCPDYNTYSSRMGYQITRLTVIPQTVSNDQLLCYAKSDRIASNTYLSELFYLRFNLNGDSVDFSPGIKWSNNTVTTGVTAFTGAVTKIVGIGRKQ